MKKKRFCTWWQRGGGQKTSMSRAEGPGTSVGGGHRRGARMLKTNPPTNQHSVSSKWRRTRRFAFALRSATGRAHEPACNTAATVPPTGSKSHLVCSPLPHGAPKAPSLAKRIHIHPIGQLLGVEHHSRSGRTSHTILQMPAQASIAQPTNAINFARVWGRHASTLKSVWGHKS